MAFYQYSYSLSLLTRSCRLLCYAGAVVFLSQCSSRSSADKAPSVSTQAIPDSAPKEANTDSAPMPDAKTKEPAAVAPVLPTAPPPRHSAADQNFVDVTTLDKTIRLDIRYATTDNFTKAQIYDCPKCLLRPEAAKQIVKVHRALREQGYGGLKMFDCYRPRPYQQRLWDKVPNPDYVTPPTKGSMHSRGAAVDLTVVDKDGKELDMGTPYDFFGPEAHTDYTRHPARVLANRRLLDRIMDDHGFKGIRTEWWHFSFRGKEYPLSSYVWPCEEK